MCCSMHGESSTRLTSRHQATQRLLFCELAMLRQSLRQGCVPTVVGRVMTVSEAGMCTHSSWSCYDSL